MTAEDLKRAREEGEKFLAEFLRLVERPKQEPRK